jgi:hypothetical protein
MNDRTEWLDEILEDAAETIHDEWCLDKKCRTSRSVMVNEHMGDEEAAILKEIDRIIGEDIELVPEDDESVTSEERIMFNRYAIGVNLEKFVQRLRAGLEKK